MTRNKLQDPRSPELREFIQRQRDLFWYIPDDKKEDISIESLVETILNWGYIDSVRELIHLLGLKKTSTVYFTLINSSDRRKNNFHELTRNYFTLFFNHYAQGSS